jgi:hypothetical protein
MRIPRILLPDSKKRGGRIRGETLETIGEKMMPVYPGYTPEI